MIYIRADGNAVTGAGHLMRCLTIAEELNKLPETAGKVCFLCADEQSGKLVSDRGLEAVVLGTDYRQMEEELPVIAALLKGDVARIFLVDSYHVTDPYLEGLSRYGQVFLLDDLGKQCRPVDGVINYNAFARKAQYQKLYQSRKDRTALLVGSDYVPVRQQFLGVPYKVGPGVRDVLITTGGGDSENIAAKIWLAIRRPEVRCHVVVGRFSRHFADWERLTRLDHGLFLHYDVKDMAGLMSRCDLAITAGGTTIYELAAIGVPFVCFSYAENQEALTEYIGEKQIAGYGGAYHKNAEQTIGRIKELTEQLVADTGLRRKMYRAEKKMIDGLGAGRIARALAERMQQE